MTGAIRLKSAAGYLGFGALLYIAFLLANAPAFWFAEAAARFSDGAVTLDRASGTLWRGAGDLQAGTPTTGTRDLGNVRWRVNPWWLLLGRAQVALEIDGPSARGHAAVRLARHLINVQDLDATVPAHLASAVYAPAAFFEPSGSLALRAPRVELSAKGLLAQLEIQWQGAGGRFTGPATLGDYRISVNGTGDNATIQLTTLRGNLDLSGQGQWHVTGDGALRFTGVAVPKADATQLEPLLRALGRDLGGGRREIHFNGRFPILQQLGW